MQWSLVCAFTFSNNHCSFRLLNIAYIRLQQLGNLFHIVVFSHYSFNWNFYHDDLSSGSKGDMVQSWILGFVGLLWITPLLVCLILAVGWQEEYLSTVYKLISINPLGLITVQMYIEFADLIEIPSEQVKNLVVAKWFGLILSSLLAVSLQTRLLAIRKQISSNQKTST